MSLPAISPQPVTRPGSGYGQEEIFKLTGTDTGTDSKVVHALIDTLRARLGPSAAKLLNTLRQWDIDGEGVVTLKEFRVAMRTLQVTPFHRPLHSYPR